MQQRLPSLRVPPIGFAHRGARAHAPENTLEAFQLGAAARAPRASRATCGSRATAWRCSTTTAWSGGRLRRRPIAGCTGAELPATSRRSPSSTTPCGTDFELSLDVKDPARGRRVLVAAASRGRRRARAPVALPPDWRAGRVVAGARPDVHLVDSTRLRRDQGGARAPRRRLADAGDRRASTCTTPTGPAG